MAEVQFIGTVVYPVTWEEAIIVIEDGKTRFIPVLGYTGAYPSKGIKGLRK